MVPTPALQRAICATLAGAPRGIAILKARPGYAGHDARACESCGGEAAPARLDIGLGDNAGLVVEDVAGWWCWGCCSAVIPGDGDEVKSRLARLDWKALQPGISIPSLAFETPEHPTSVQFEVTTRCNLTCPYCTHRDLPSKVDMAVERFTKLLGRIDMRRVDNVDFTGLGEPALHLELPEMIEAVRRASAPTHIRIVTNGTAMTRKRFEPLCAAGVTSIAFSIDSLDPERFERSREGARLGPVLDNLEALVAYRECAGLDDLEVKIKAVLLGDPFAEAEPLLRYSAQLGIAMPHFSCLDERARTRDHYRETWLDSSWASDVGAELARWAEARWAELTGKPPARPPRGLAPTQREVGFVHPDLAPAGLCRWAVDAAFVSVDGDCLPCCEQMIDLPRPRRGSLDVAPLGELWGGDLLWAYRLPLSAGLIPDGCAGCAWAPAV